jgi:lipooligosaccharide transport system permease protein
MIRLDAVSWRFTRVWMRNLVTYKRIWKVSFITPVMEPLLYVVAFGVGFSGLVNQVYYKCEYMRYIDFMAPALFCTATMYNAFFETTYASFVRMYFQKSFDAMLATPLSLEEIILAEIVWSATKATAAATLVTIVLAMFGLVNLPSGLLVVPIAFLGGLAFGAVGLFFTGIIPTIEMFNLPIFLFVTPMFLFSGTFFPVSNLPDWAQPAAAIFPLHHLVELVRAVCIGMHERSVGVSLGFLAAFAVVFAFLATAVMRKRLIN